MVSDSRVALICTLLSPQSAGLLLVQSSPVATAVVSHVSEMLNYWESHHVELDPIQREVVLDSVVAGLVGLHLGFESTVAELSHAYHTLLGPTLNGPEVHADQGTRGT